MSEGWWESHSRRATASGMELMTYADYLQTNHWKRLRRVKLEQANYHCHRCESTWYLQVHHRVYRKSWYDSIPEDLEVVCGYCHKKEHGILRVNDRPIYTYKEREEIVAKLCPNNIPKPKPIKPRQPAPFNPKRKVTTIMNELVHGVKMKPIIPEIDRAIESLRKLKHQLLELNDPSLRLYGPQTV
jgi:hypothetical protein